MLPWQQNVYVKKKRRRKKKSRAFFDAELLILNVCKISAWAEFINSTINGVKKCSCVTGWTIDAIVCAWIMFFLFFPRSAPKLFSHYKGNEKTWTMKGCLHTCEGNFFSSQPKQWTQTICLNRKWWMDWTPRASGRGPEPSPTLMISKSRTTCWTPAIILQTIFELECPDVGLILGKSCWCLPTTNHSP